MVTRADHELQQACPVAELAWPKGYVLLSRDIFKRNSRTLDTPTWQQDVLRELMVPMPTLEHFAGPPVLGSEFDTEFLPEGAPGLLTSRWLSYSRRQADVDELAPAPKEVADAVYYARLPFATFGAWLAAIPWVLMTLGALLWLAAFPGSDEGKAEAIAHQDQQYAGRAAGCGLFIRNVGNRFRCSRKSVIGAFTLSGILWTFQVWLPGAGFLSWTIWFGQLCVAGGLIVALLSAAPVCWRADTTDDGHKAAILFTVLGLTNWHSTCDIHYTGVGAVDISDIGGYHGFRSDSYSNSTVEAGSTAWNRILIK